MPADLERLQRQLNYRFVDAGLAERAITHRSADRIHNERLEFLGDSILGLVVAEALFERFPDATEGELSRMRANLVNRETLADIAKSMDLGSQLLLGAGERKSGGKRRASILSDAVEALFAAIYLDGGLQACRESVLHLYDSRLGQITSVSRQKDSKTALQELLQARGLPLPTYTVQLISGEAHDQTFQVACQVASLQQVQLGSGKSKRLAEQDAAEKVLVILEAPP
ncbi:MAG: ribonuclease [Pseudomonadota bacterium]|jgi:ribonuclease-3